MPWPKGKSRKRYYAGKKAWATRLRKRGFKKVAKGGAGLIPKIGEVLSIVEIGSGFKDIMKSRKYSKQGKRR